jgi:hypothetical protein
MAWKSALVMTLLASVASAADGGGPDYASMQAKDPARSVQALYAKCTAVDLHEQMFCAGYFAASVDNMMVLGSGASTQAFGICPKTTVSPGAAAQAFKNWAQQNPAAWGIDLYAGALWALQSVWPCK